MDVIESKYLLDIDETLKSLNAAADGIDEVAAKQDKLNKQGLGGLNSELADYQRKLASGVSIYQKVETSAKGLTEELKRLRDIEKALIKAQVEFADSAKFDTVKKDLEVVRDRINQVKDAFDNVGKSSKKSKGEITGFKDLAVEAGLAVAAMFTVDKAIQVGESIFEATKNYEKYFAVIRNGFQDEQRASSSLAMIYEFAKKTPYQVNELTDSYVKLINRGFIPSMAEMTKMGDLASSQGKSFGQWTEALLDAEANQYERLREFGIGFETIGNKVVFTFRGIRKEVDKTNSEAIRNALISFGELNGVVGAMSARSLTLEGATSNLSDSYDQLLTVIGSGNSGAMKEFVLLLQSGVEWTKSLFEIPLAEKYREEQIEVNALIGSLIQYKDNAQQRNAILTELGQKYPSILKLIGSEVTTTEHLGLVLAQVNREYERKIQLAGLQEAVNLKTKAQAELQNKILDQEKLIQKTVEERLKKQGNAVLLDRYRMGDTNTRTNIEQSVLRDLNTRAAGQTMNLGNRGVTEESTKAINFQIALESRNKLNKESNELTQDAITLAGKMSAKEAENIALLKKSQSENEAQIKKLKEKGKLTKEETATLKALTAATEEYQKREKIADGSFKPTKVASMATDKEAAKKAEKERQALANEYEKLLELQKSFMQQMNSLKLEESNIRLQMLDKDSKEYLERKRSYDLMQVDSEVEKYKKLFDIQSGKAVSDGKGGSKIQSFTEGRINEMQKSGMSKEEAQKAADFELEIAFINSKETKEVRELMRLKMIQIDKAYFDDLAKMEEQANQESLNLMGEGLSKELAQIDVKYKRLMEKYGENENLLRQALISYNVETEKAISESKIKALEGENQTKKGNAGSITQRSGELESDFEKRQKQILLDIDKEFYSKKLALLLEFTEKQSYIEAVANGSISKEESDSYQLRISELKSAISELDKEAVKSSVNIPKYGNNWELVGDIFEQITDKALKFSENSEVDKFVKNSISAGLQYAKDGLSELIKMEVAATEERISLLNDSISKRENLVSEEYEKYKSGLSNRYEFEKGILDQTKREREKELENKKKLQKQQAVIDSLEILSTNAVATANMIVAASKAIADGASKGLVGIAVGIAVAASLAGIFLGIKSKFKAAQKLRKGKRLEGKSHENGGFNILDSEGNIQYEGEGGEWLLGSEPSKKHNTLLSEINTDNFKNLNSQEQKRLLRPLGFKMHEASMAGYGSDMDTKRSYDKYRATSLALSKRQVDYLEQMALNSGNSDNFQFVYLGNNKVGKFDKKDRLIKIITVNE